MVFAMSVEFRFSRGVKPHFTEQFVNPRISKGKLSVAG